MDSLLQAIFESPDDDAPRLVWADREGGDRGELVVLQCMLARRDGTRADRVRWQTRVRALRERFETRGWTFVRGFIERARLKLDDITTELFEEMPLLRDIELDYDLPQVRRGEGTVAEVWAEESARFAAAFAQVPPGLLRKLEAQVAIVERGEGWQDAVDHGFADAFIEILAAAPGCARLVELNLLGGAFTAAAGPHLARLGVTTFAGGSGLDGAACVELLRAAPALRIFGPWNGKPMLHGEQLATLLASPEARRLNGLDLWSQGLGDLDLDLIARTPFERLTRLGIGNSAWTETGLAVLAAAPHPLVELDILLASSALRASAPAAFLAPPFAIERLRISPIAELLDALASAPTLDWLHVDSGSAHLPWLQERIPFVNESYRF